MQMRQHGRTYSLTRFWTDSYLTPAVMRDGAVDEAMRHRSSLPTRTGSGVMATSGAASSGATHRAARLSHSRRHQVSRQIEPKSRVAVVAASVIVFLLSGITRWLPK